MDARAAVGRYGEGVAARFLVDAGLTILERNWRCRWGEIDIVAVDGDCLVVCEVKTRRSPSCGAPEEAVTPLKLRRLRRLAAAWLAEQDRHFGDVRLDVVSVVRPLQGAALVEHLRGVG